MPFQLVVITPESTSSSEPQLARALFERGLEVLHVRKPRASAAEVAQYLEALPPAYRRRCQLHQHHDLRRRTAIRGIHYREADRPEGIIKAPAGLAGGQLGLAAPRIRAEPAGAAPPLGGVTWHPCCQISPI